MKSKIYQFAVAVVLAAAASGAAYAHEDNSEARTNHWLSHLWDKSDGPSANAQARYGYPATETADREVTLAGGSQYLNVTRMETVRINVAGKSVVWTFDTLGTQPFPLSKVIPGADGVTVYVNESPYYQGG